MYPEQFEAFSPLVNNNNFRVPRAKKEANKVGRSRLFDKKSCCNNRGVPFFSTEKHKHGMKQESTKAPSSHSRGPPTCFRILAESAAAPSLSSPQ